MNIVEWRKLGEALETWDRSRAPNLDLFHVDPLVAAARLTYDRYQECEKCLGDGFLWMPSPNVHSEKMVCPRCGGSGLLPNQTPDYKEAHRIIDNWMVDNAPESKHYVPTGVVVDAVNAAVRAFDKETVANPLSQDS